MCLLGLGRVGERLRDDHLAPVDYFSLADSEGDSRKYPATCVSCFGVERFITGVR